MPSKWCTVCCTSHGEKSECPGQLLATGHERHGWRVNVDTPRGIEACSVLVAECGGLWRARILTYPNILWTIPGGSGALKFAGDSPQAAEQQAIAFIKEHFRALGYRMRDGADKVEPLPIEPEAADPSLSRPAGRPALRKIRFLPVHYGIARMTEKGGTGNLSETGLFIITNSPESEGSWLNLMLELDGHEIDMRGLVRWMNNRPHAGRSPGMGIQIVAPPPRYTSYVRLLS
jgi:hypothetical protein